MTDNELTSRTSVTYKTGEKYKESLINFSGEREAVRADQIAYFGLKPSECDGRTDFEIRLMCDAVAQAVTTVQNKLGAVLATKSEETAANAAASTQPRDQIPAAVHEAMKDGDPWKAAEGASSPAKAEAADPTPNPVDVMIDTVNSQTSVKALQLVWAENKVLFDANPEIMAAYKAKGKSLQAAA
ncbi:hypothetical protein [Kribbella italica]|uniref:Uncharacterized protein n=1 Tax=Kribbella italica TaxID=1540520 RepID=A0A7W9J1Y8_9ACTN|nr:hypothetical protein [Kribbella italica]MBB5833398.1 hypothetical protein [Kribbella italica]